MGGKPTPWSGGTRFLRLLSGSPVSEMEFPCHSLQSWIRAIPLWCFRRGFQGFGVDDFLWFGGGDVPPMFQPFWSGFLSEFPETVVGHGSTQLSGPFSGRSSFISSGSVVSENWTVVIHEFKHSLRRGKNQFFRFALVSPQCPGFSYSRLLSSPSMDQCRKGQGFPGLSGTFFGGRFGSRRGLFRTRKSPVLGHNVYLQHLRQLIILPPVTGVAQRLEGSPGWSAFTRMRVPWRFIADVGVRWLVFMDEVPEEVSDDSPQEEAPGRRAPVWDLVLSSSSEGIPVGDGIGVQYSEFPGIGKPGNPVGRCSGLCIQSSSFPSFPLLSLSFPFHGISQFMGFVPVPEYSLYIPWFFSFPWFSTPISFLSHSFPSPFSCSFGDFSRHEFSSPPIHYSSLCALS